MVRPIQSCLEEFQLLPAPEPLHAERPVRPMAEIRRAGASEDAWQRGYEEGRAKAQAQADAQLWKRSNRRVRRLMRPVAPRPPVKPARL